MHNIKRAWYFRYFRSRGLDTSRASIAADISLKNEDKASHEFTLDNYIIWVGELVRKWPDSWCAAFIINGYSWEGIELPA